MNDTSPFHFAALYADLWRHERCHLREALNVFPTIPDPRIKLEAVVRKDTGAFHREAMFGANGFKPANDLILSANTIDQTLQPYKFWGRNDKNNGWLLLGQSWGTALAPGC
jgi:hypothetical protein